MSEGGAAAGETSAGQAGASGEDCTTERNLKLSGRLTTPLGEPVARAEVRLSGSTLPLTSTRTDDDGNYAFEGLCAGRYRLNSCLYSEMQVTLDGDHVQDVSGMPGSCDASALKPNVLLLVYDPVIPGAGEALQQASTKLEVGDLRKLADQLVDFVHGASGGHLQPSIPSVRLLPELPPRSDGAVYTPEQYAHCLDDELECLPPGNLALDAIAVQQELCAAVWNNSLDEIWLLRGPHLGSLPLQSLKCSHPERDVEKQVDVVGLGFARGRGLDGLLSDYQHRMHEALLATFTNTSGTDDHYASFSQVASETSAQKVSGCGQPSFAPNAQQADRFDDLAEVSSYCDAFFDYPARDDLVPLASPLSCKAWGCTERGFRRYWFRHLPRARWLDDAGRLNDFWRLATRPDERDHVGTDAEGEVKPICSSSYEPDWCKYVHDEKTGRCNEGEWAADHETTGHVEWFYAPKRLVTSVTLYDRACTEWVKAGHIEFSDGSPDVTFGPLDERGITPTTISFEPKLLSGLRVVIDESSGENAGFAEISIASTQP